MWIIIIVIPLLIAWWVATDATRRGYSKSTTLLWFLGVWLALIVFLPLYLILRPRTPRQDGMPRQEEYRGKTQVCPYCGKLYQGKIFYCPYCGQKLDEEV